MHQNYSHTQLLKTMLSYELMNHIDVILNSFDPYANTKDLQELKVVKNYIQDRIKELGDKQ